MNATAIAITADHMDRLATFGSPCGLMRRVFSQLLRPSLQSGRVARKRADLGRSSDDRDATNTTGAARFDLVDAQNKPRVRSL